MIATVNVIQDFIGDDGKWVLGGQQGVNIAEGTARDLAAKGYVEIVAVDGQLEHFRPCCAGE